MKVIQLTQNQVALVDDEDFDRVNQYNWCANYFRTIKSYYALRGFNKKKPVLMHNFIMNSFRVDHVDHNTLNNQKYNLRTCTQSQNMSNTRKHIDGSSQYKGVYWHKLNKKWIANITFKYKMIYLGSFLNEKDAALAYNKAAIQYFGEFAYLNILNE